MFPHPPSQSLPRRQTHHHFPALPRIPSTVLTIRLRDALLSPRELLQSGSLDKSKTFQTVLVDRVRSAVFAVILSP